METEEAIETLQLMMGLKVPGETKAVGLAIEALKKQVKRKPKHSPGSCVYTCSVCGVWIGNSHDEDDDNFYCYSCGQAIDWTPQYRGEKND